MLIQMPGHCLCGSSILAGPSYPRTRDTCTLCAVQGGTDVFLSSKLTSCPYQRLVDDEAGTYRRYQDAERGSSVGALS